MTFKYYRLMFFQALFTLVIFITLILLFVRHEDSRLDYLVNTMGQTLSYSVQQHIDTSEGVLNALAYNYEVDPDLSEDKFEILASYFIKLNPDIIYIQHKNKETVTDMVYPDTYAYTLGATLLGRKEVEEAVNKAINERIITANTPFILKNTDDLLGLIIRYPLYKEEAFNGFFVAVINVNDYVNKIITEDVLIDYTVGIYDDQETMFWGEKETSSKHTYTAKISILDNFWTLKISYKEPKISTTFIFVTLATLLYLFIIGLLVYMQLQFLKKDKNIKYLASLKKELEKVKESYSLALDSANDALWEWNLKTGEIFTSDKWLEITGNEMAGQGMEAILQKETIHPEDFEKVMAELDACRVGKCTTFNYEYRIKDNFGDYNWVQNRGKVYIDEQDQPSIMAGSVTNIDERKQRESRIEYMAYYDTLTGLPNKAQFMGDLENELIKLPYSEKHSSILMLDLDNFKVHNDLLGLDFCDQLLKHIGETIAEIVDATNLTARFGGDEFLILLKDADNQEKCEAVCNKILEIFNKPFVLDYKIVHITASIGVVCCLDAGQSASELIRNVDTALNKAKESGKNQYCFYDSNMHEEILRKSKIEFRIREAINSSAFMIHYQLQQNLEDGSIRGIEALARLSDTELGMISPSEFIAIAEYTGLIIPLGNWILKNACMQGKEWLDMGYSIGKLSVNISINQLYRSDFLEEVKDILDQTGFPVGCLELEITESVLLDSNSGNMDILRSLKNLGLNIALDDFGTGYSSMNYLTIMPIDTLKIDKSFIDKAVEHNLENQVIKSIIELAHNINLNVVAEGVETQLQREMLIEMNCDSIQGYYFAKPMAAPEVEKILAKKMK